MNVSRGTVGSDLAKADAYENTAEDYHEVPELDEAFFAHAVLHRNGAPVDEDGSGRAPSTLTLKLDPEVIARFRAAGPGWERRMEDILRRAVGL